MEERFVRVAGYSEAVTTGGREEDRLRKENVQLFLEGNAAEAMRTPSGRPREDRLTFMLF